VTVAQWIFGSGLMLFLLALAGWTLWRQVLRLRALGSGEPLPPDEAAHLRASARRRLACGVLMSALGLLLGVAMLFLEGPAQELADRGPLAAEAPEQRDFVRLYGWFWEVFLLLLLALVLLAGWDRAAERRHGWRQMRRLQQDRREMIAHQTALLRQQRDQES
jgi:hypothetical protein